MDVWMNSEMPGFVTSTESGGEGILKSADGFHSINKQKSFDSKV